MLNHLGWECIERCYGCYTQGNYSNDKKKSNAAGPDLHVNTACSIKFNVPVIFRLGTLANSQ